MTLAEADIDAHCILSLDLNDASPGPIGGVAAGSAACCIRRRLSSARGPFLRWEIAIRRSVRLSYRIRTKRELRVESDLQILNKISRYRRTPRRTVRKDGHSITETNS
jgi:hypothetical protein